MITNKQPSLLLLIAIAMASPLALNLFIPAMPDVAKALNADIAKVQLTYTLYLLTLAFGQLISGALADFLGRYPILVAGLSLHVVGCLIAAFALDIDMLILARMVQALGGSACMTMARTIMLDIYPKEKAASKMSYLVMAIALSQTIAPTLGGYINLLYGWQTIFYLSALIAISVWLLNIFTLSETCTNKSSELSLAKIFIQYGQVLRSPQYIGYALSSTFIACAFYIFIGSMPYIVVNHLGGSSADFGNWFLGVALSFTLGSFCSGSLARKIAIDGMIRLGNTLSLVGGLTLLLISVSGHLSYLALFAPMALLTFGRGLSQPSAQSGAISCASTAAGSASGLLGFIQLIIGAAIAQLVPTLLAQSITMVTAAIFVATLLAWLTHKIAQH